MQRVLVIKLGALGDLVLCARVFASIRAAFPKAEIALLTGKAFVGFAQSMPWFDQVIEDPRPSFKELGAWRTLIRAVRGFAPTHVFDFQAKTRQNILYAALGGPFGPFWSGAAPFCKAPRLWPPKPEMHYTDFVAAQIERASVPLAPLPSFDWLSGDLSVFALPERFALLIPGCAPTRLYKRWPAEHYAAVALALQEKGIASVLIGTASEAEVLETIQTLVPGALNLCGQTTLGQIAALARLSVCGLGNDTGPSHIAAAMGRPFLSLMPTDKVNVTWCVPKGPQSAWLGAGPLSDLQVEAVLKELQRSIM